MSWPRWRTDQPAALGNYVLPEATVRYLQAPPSGGTPPVVRLSGLYDVFVAAGIAYAYESGQEEPGFQVIRPPDQVLLEPRHGTCLDIAVAFSAACLGVQLHPLIAIAGGVGGVPDHALVLVWVGTSDDPERSDWRGGASPHWPLGAASPDPADILELGVRSEPSGGGQFVALDVSRAATGYADGASFEDAVKSGAAAFGSSSVVADIGRTWREQDQLRPSYRVHAGGPALLEPPYVTPDGQGPPAPSVLTWARHEVVPFQTTDEYQLIRDSIESNGLSISVLSGPGGVGKTRLAAELAKVFGQRGWLSGFVPLAEPTDVGRLEAVVSPVLAVVDYADGRPTDELISLLTRLSPTSGQGPRAVLLTSRPQREWWDVLSRGLRQTGLEASVRHWEIEPASARPRRVWANAVRAMQRWAELPVEEVPLPVLSDEITELDLVLLAWLAVYSPDSEPNNRNELYEEISYHEFKYWAEVYRSTTGGSVPSQASWCDYAAALTLTAPRALAHARDAVMAVPSHSEADSPGRRVVETFTRLWSGDKAEGGMTLRPDRVGDALVRRVIVNEPGFLAAVTGRAVDWDDPSGTERIFSTLARAATDTLSGEEMVALRDAIVAVVTDVPDALDHLVTTAVRGSALCVAALDALLSSRDDPLFAEALNRRLPSGHVHLLDLAVRTAELTRSVEDRAGEASRLANLGVRLSEAGRRDEALEPAQQAVDIYRQLAEVNPAAYLPDLAMSLNNLGGQLPEAGSPDEPLAPPQQALDIYRQLAEVNPAAYLPNLAGSLTNLGGQLSEAGRRDEALEPAQQAVDIRRQLAEVNPAAYLPELAMSLSNLGGQLSEAGRRDEALEPTQQAVDIYRQLAEVNPAAYLPELAGSLNNLGAQLLQAGRRDEALEPAQQAVDTYRQLAEVNPAAYLPELAMSLNNLGAQLSQAGRRDEALEPTQQAVDIHRQLAEVNPSAYLPDLAASLNYLGNRLVDNGRAAEVDLVWEALGASLDQLTQGWLLAHYARRLSAAGQDSAAAGVVARGAALLEDPTGADDRTLGLARRSLRSAANSTGVAPVADEHWPQWLTCPLSDDLRELAARLSSIASWDDERRILQRENSLTDPQVQADLRALAHLHPETNLASRLRLLEHVGEVGLDAYLEEGEHAHALVRSINEWVGAQTWTESKSNFLANIELLSSDGARRLLAQSADEDIVAAQHLAILAAIESHPTDEVFEWVSDAGALLDAINELLDAGAVETVGSLISVNPAVGSLLPHGGLVLALALSRQGALEAATKALESAFAEASPNAVAVARNRLGRLASVLEPTVSDRLISTLSSSDE